MEIVFPLKCDWHLLVFVIFEFCIFSTAVASGHDFRYVTLNSMNASRRQYEKCRIDDDYYCNWQIEENRLRQSIIWEIRRKKAKGEIFCSIEDRIDPSYQFHLHFKKQVPSPIPGFILTMSV